MMDIASFFQSKEKMRLVIILALIGIVLMVLPMLMGRKEEAGTTARPDVNSVAGANTPTHTSGLTETEKAMERNLQEVLAQVEGAGQVAVRVSLNSTAEMEYAVNSTANDKKTEEKDPQGGSRVITETNENGQLVMLRQSGQSGENPVVIKEIKPEVQGVVVVSSGASDVEVKARLLQAVQTYFNIPSYRVAVLPRSGGALK